MVAPRKPLFSDFNDTGGFTAYAPAVTSSIVGSMTNSNITGKYKLISYNTYLLICTIGIIAKGTSNGKLLVDMPFQCTNDAYTGFAIDQSNGGTFSVAVYPLDSRLQFNITNMDFTSCIADNRFFRSNLIFTI